MKIYFLTTNANKVEEARRFFDEENVAGLRGITLEVITRDVQGDSASRPESGRSEEGARSVSPP